MMGESYCYFLWLQNESGLLNSYFVVNKNIYFGNQVVGVIMIGVGVYVMRN